eukprot:Skav226705  [mRNA]  locus=scaffold3811:49529:53953:- [translate_table: standard]
MKELTRRIVYQSYGPRAIVGDFNGSCDDYAEVQEWKRHGFVEIQQLAQQLWGQEPQVTCKQRTIKDFVFVPRELQAHLTKVVVLPHHFADHSALLGEFSQPMCHQPVPIWIRPLPLPWEECSLDDVVVPDTLPLEMTIPDVFATLEKVVDAHLGRAGKGSLVNAQRGRVVNTTPRLARQTPTPIRRSRKHEVTIEYHGENWRHTQWTRQLRRLQSYVALASSEKDSEAIKVHRAELWVAIRSAQGFPRGFQHVFHNHLHKSMGCPDYLPKRPPSLEVVRCIFQTFLDEFRRLEKALNRARIAAAQTRRCKDSTVIFKDIGKPKSLAVQTVVAAKSAIVTEITDDGQRIHYEPGLLQLDEPVWVGQTMLLRKEHVDGSFWVDQATQLEVGDKLEQQVFQGDLGSVFKAFGELWGPMWNNPSHAKPGRWDSFIHDLAHFVEPSHEKFTLGPLTTMQWINTVRSRKKHSAMGPDGVDRQDLLLMPPPLVSKLVDAINRIDRGCESWPRPCLVGLITSIGKHAEAAKPSDYRPITVLSQVYRTWASVRAKELLRWLSRRAPDTLHGNKKHTSTINMWWNLACEVEEAYLNGGQVSGLVTDITKCFNVLPRHVVYACGIHLGIDPVFMRTWIQNLRFVERRFVVRGACSEEHLSSSGFPEGDPLSVVGMMVVNIAMHKIVEGKSPSCRVHTFVDNWEITSSCPHALLDGHRHLENFASEIAVQLDVRKTYGWSTDTEARKKLKQDGLSVKYHERDLGGHVGFSRLHTNYTIVDRMKVHKPMWTWLRRSFAPNEQKLQMLRSVAWPRMLHGIAGVIVGAEHLRKLRSQAMQAFGWNKQGASALIQLGLQVEPSHDPEFWSLLQTTLTVRQVGNHARLCANLDDLVGDRSAGAAHGPCRTFLARIHDVGWSWDGNGFVVDHQGLRHSLFHAPVQVLMHRLQHAWQQRIGSIMCTRKEFEGLSAVDADLTRNLAAQHSDNEGVVRTALNGTFYTMDKLVKTTKAADDRCPWCQSPDSLQHRLWECPHFGSCRMDLSAAERSEILNLPDCSRLHGWACESPKLVAFQHALMEVPDTTGDIFLPESFVTPRLQLFTDGSCASPLRKPGRLATWGVVCADFEGDTFVPVSCGGVPGLAQTALRGEITAAIAAVKTMLLRGCSANIWTDNDTVYKRLSAMFANCPFVVTAAQKDHDLWGLLAELVQKALNVGLDCCVLKVRSHQDDQVYSDPVELWVIRGNARADELADQARSMLPRRLLRLWEQVMSHHHHQQSLMTKVMGVIASVGSAAVQNKKQVQAQQEMKMDLRVHDDNDDALLSLRDEEGCIPLPLSNSAYGVAPQVEGWLDELQNESTGRRVWISFYQLFVLYQHQTGGVGFYYDTKQRRWCDAAAKVDREGYDFLGACHGFSGVIRCIAKAKKQRCVVERKCPCGTVMRCWVCAVHVCIDQWKIDLIEQLFRNGGVSTIRDVKKSLRGFQIVPRHNVS